MAKRKNTFIHKPVYPGGKEALQAFIKKHLRYPEEAIKKQTEGSVRVDYSLNQQGKVIKALAINGPKDGCREEAERLVKMLRFQVPKDYKMSVRYHQHLNINFKAPVKVERAGPKSKPLSQITYTVTVKPKPDSESTPKTPPNDKHGYGYTIEW